MGAIEDGDREQVGAATIEFNDGDRGVVLLIIPGERLVVSWCETSSVTVERVWRIDEKEIVGPAEASGEEDQIVPEVVDEDGRHDQYVALVAVASVSEREPEESRVSGQNTRGALQNSDRLGQLPNGRS